MAIRLGAAAVFTATPAPTASSPVTIQASDDDDDDDNAFIRNKATSTTSRFQALAKRNKTAKTKAIELSSDSDSASGNGESDGTPKPSKKKGKGKPKPQPQPTALWKKRRPIARLATTSDEDEVIVLKDSNGARDAARATKSKKRDRSSSESSGSLTPPPELTAEERARARAVVETTLQIPAAKRQRTPPIDVDGFDFIDSNADLNPELRQIAERVRAATMHKKPSTSVQSGDSESICAKVQWIPHPASDHGVAPRLWSVIISRGETFAHSLLPKLMEDTGALDIVLRYDGKRVFRTSTPHSLDLWGEVDFLACTPATLDYLAASHDEEVAPSSPIERAISEAPSEASVDDDVDDSFSVILRAKDQKDVTLKVKPTATAAKVVVAYLKKIPAGASMSATKKQKVHLFVDGQKVNSTTTLAELDLEDEDVLDIRGL